MKIYPAQQPVPSVKKIIKRWDHQGWKGRMLAEKLPQWEDGKDITILQLDLIYNRNVSLNKFKYWVVWFQRS